jgi:enterochelin esterase family protein
MNICIPFHTSKAFAIVGFDYRPAGDIYFCHWPESPTWLLIPHPMKPLLLATLLLALPAAAQPIRSPEVLPDGRVTFRLRATNANEVIVRCEGFNDAKMQKDDQGVWSLTSPAMAPDIYTYTFSVDGLRLLDPNNPLLKYNLLNSESELCVPGPKSLSWEINDVPRGKLHRHFYKSKVAGDERDFIVYTPPGYDPASRKQYPTLYLLHGFSDDATAWSTVGRANVILDNLIARGQAKPMIVVMPLGYGTMEYVLGGWTGARRGEMRQISFDKFRENLFQEVIPQAEQSYRISADRKLRAIAGLSMGGAESLDVGLNALDRFAWIGAFSSGGLNTNYSAQFPHLDEKANRQLRLLWLACGKDDRLISSNQQFNEWLTSKKINYTWQESAGGHNFRVWRRYLGEFAPLLFQERK